MLQLRLVLEASGKAIREKLCRFVEGDTDAVPPGRAAPAPQPALPLHGAPYVQAKLPAGEQQHMMHVMICNKKLLLSSM